MGPKPRFVPLICAILFFASCAEAKIVIDHESDSGLMSNTCSYVESYADNYWAWGCPSQIDRYGHETDGTGFWSACKKSSCEMIYYENMIRKPASVHIEAFVEGSGVLEVSGKRTPTFPQFWYVASNQSAGENQLCAGTLEVDLLNFFEVETFAIKIAAMSDRNGYVLIDKITICFEGETDCMDPSTKAFTCDTAPTEPPPPTPGPTEPPSSAQSISVKELSILLSTALIAVMSLIL